MKYIITSGPMESQIDSVRKIKNSSSGKLGTVFAEQLLKRGYSNIVYIHTSGALVPDKVKTIEIDGHKQLLSALEREITDDSVIVHAMAISDFNIKGTNPIECVADAIYSNLDQIETREDIVKLINANVKLTDKLSSSNDQLVVMERAIKVIDQIKKINSNCKLIGFKLLSNVSDEELISVATGILNRANCDYVVANIKEQVKTESHRAIIVGDDYQQQVLSKQEIANTIIDLMEE